MKIQAFFWDYDNTILATAEAHWNKHCLVLAKHGIFLEQKFRKKVYENNGNQNWQWIQEELGLQITQEQYLKEIDEEFQRHMQTLAMRPGVEAMIQFLDKLQIPQAIITNARRDSAAPILEKKNIAAHMKFILFKEDYEGRKPNPSPYLQGFKKMEEFTGTAIFPNRCIAVEDDPKGVESAHLAGAIVIHRKLHETDPGSLDANYCCYFAEEFSDIVTKLLHQKQ